mmetsp:Transcript_63258/g.169112  ORF Transcript_63258/g.169112 Transcript_63258/m.169112 type:complete len:217 (-) Transcript_63258:1100-1750(-)
MDTAIDCKEEFLVQNSTKLFKQNVVFKFAVQEENLHQVCRATGSSAIVAGCCHPTRRTTPSSSTTTPFFAPPSPTFTPPAPPPPSSPPSTTSPRAGPTHSPPPRTQHPQPKPTIPTRTPATAATTPMMTTSRGAPRPPPVRPPPRRGTPTLSRALPRSEFHPTASPFPCTPSLGVPGSMACWASADLPPRARTSTGAPWTAQGPVAHAHPPPVAAT